MPRETVQWGVRLLLAVMSSSVAGLNTVCPITSQQILSANTDLLPLSGVQTTGESSRFNPLGNLVNPPSSPWCTAAHSNSRLVPDLQVTLNFTEPVRLSMIVSSGFINGYVNNFTIEYTATLDDYTTYVTASGTKHFFVEDLDVLDAYFVLEQPIDVQRVKLSILGDVLDDSNRTCWELYLFGCALQDTGMDDITTVLGSYPTPSCSPSPVPSCSPATNSENVSTDDCASSGMSQGEVLAIVLPVALVTILATVVITVVGIVVCITNRRHSRLGSKEGGYETVTIKVLNSKPTERPVQLYHPTPRRRVMSDVARPVSVASVMSKTSTNTFPGKMVYDVPRPTLYDIPRSATLKGRSSTRPAALEFPNALYDMPPSDELVQSPVALYDMPPSDELVQSPTALYDMPPSDELVQSPTGEADYDEIPEEAPDSARIRNNAREKPPLPLPNKAVSNGVQHSLRGTGPGKEVMKDKSSPHEVEKQTVIPTVPHTYSQVNKKGKDQAITSH